jgi:hypothetical protein
MSWLLLAAQAGASLFQARASTQAAGQQALAQTQSAYASALETITSTGEQAAFQAGAATFTGVLERFQIKEQAAYEGMMRHRALAQAMGAQRAASSAAGVIGGRTQQLLEARSQAAFTTEQMRARLVTELAFISSEQRQRTTVEGVRLEAATAARRAQVEAASVASGAKIEAAGAAKQAQVSMFGDMLKIGTKAVDLFQTTKATTGPTT